VAQPPRDHAFVKTTKPKAAAAASIGAGLADRKRAEPLGLLRPCFVRAGPWLQAGKYVGALVSGLPKRNGWTIAEHAGDRTPDRTQRLLNRAAWDTFAAMSEVRRFAVASSAGDAATLNCACVCAVQGYPTKVSRSLPGALDANLPSSRAGQHVPDSAGQEPLPGA
jgi:hypothetical protein